jgi:NH3-dependent NAD+ synthetase
LPPYEELDPLLSCLLVKNLPQEELIEDFGQDLVREALGRLGRAEYKRRQLPLVIKVSPKAFGMGRRWPITCGFSG